jgi:hypothetical protein
MADKESESVPYIHISDASFLKRSFVPNNDVGTVLAPLDPASIDKMLTAYVDNGVLAPQAHSVCAIETALREYFFYGKEIFEDRYLFFKQVVKECELEDWIKPSTFPTFHSLTYDYWRRTRSHEEALSRSEHLA